MIKHFLANKGEEYEKREVKKDKWTDSDDAYLKLNFSNLEIPLYEIADELGRSCESVRTRAFILGIKRGRVDLWTKEEDEYLKANYENKDIPMEQIFEHLKHRPRRGIYHRTKRLGLKRTRYKLTPSDIDFIINEKKLKIPEIAEKLGVSISAVRVYLDGNNVKRYKNWTEEEEDYLKLYYQDKSVPMQTILDYLGRSCYTIRDKAKSMGLSRNPKPKRDKRIRKK